MEGSRGVIFLGIKLGDYITSETGEGFQVEKGGGGEFFQDFCRIYTPDCFNSAKYMNLIAVLN